MNTIDKYIYREDTILTFSLALRLRENIKWYHFFKTHTFSFYFMLIDDERMELDLFSVFVPVQTRTNPCECICLLHNVRQRQQVRFDKFTDYGIIHLSR